MVAAALAASASAAFGAEVEALSPPGEGTVTAPVLRVGSSGDAVVAWSRVVVAAGRRLVLVEARPWSAATGRFGPRRVLAAAGDLGGVSAAAGAAGGLAVAWATRVGAPARSALGLARGDARAGVWRVESGPRASPVAGLAAPAVALDGRRRPVVAALERAGGRTTPVIFRARGAAWRRGASPGAGPAPGPPVLGVTGVGDAIALWSAGGTLRAAGWPDGAARPGVAAVVGPLGDGVRILGVGPGGGGTVAWGPPPEPRIATRTAGGAWMPVAAPPGGSADLAADAAGGLIAVRAAPDGSVLASERPPGAGAWTGPVALGGPGAPAQEVRVSAAPDGAAIATWLVPSAGGGRTLVAARRPGAGAAWLPAAAVAEEGPSAGPAGDGVLALAPDGTALAVWTVPLPGGRRAVRAVAVTARDPAPVRGPA